MAVDAGECLKILLVHGSTKHQLLLRAPDEDTEVLTVGHLSRAAAELTEVPPANQRLIYKGRSLTLPDETLQSLGVKQGAKVMLLGKKPEAADREDIQKLVMVEKSLEKHATKLTDIQYQVDGIEKGFMDTEHHQEALRTLEKQLGAVVEVFMNLLEILDALRFEENNKSSRIRRKNIVDKIQQYLSQCDSVSHNLHSLQKHPS